MTEGRSRLPVPQHSEDPSRGGTLFMAAKVARFVADDRANQAPGNR